MPVDIVIGTQWGDEGKAKVIDYISERADIVVRYQGGANAGHTVVVGEKEFIFHLLPSGMLHKNIVGVLGNGMVIDLIELQNEIKAIKKLGFERLPLLISEMAHIVMPYHKELDSLFENLREKKVGTTSRGIGPAYGDKYLRLGIRMGDLFDEEKLKQKIKERLPYINSFIKCVFSKEKEYSFEDIWEYLKQYGFPLTGYIWNVSYYLERSLLEDKNIILEGAQGTLLDIDFGTYPYVTSSNPTIGGALSGSGINHKYIRDIIGVVKAYTTRVGEGPFPTEEKGEIGEKIREVGKEYGATTGRPRRCGWIDLPALKYAVMLNGINKIAITKLDVLSVLDEIKICVAYEIDGKMTDEFIPSLIHKAKPIYQTIKGWKEDISSCRNFEELPEKAKEYLDIIKNYLGDIEIILVSVGPKRRESICI
jgi:adenylosuccinate synthase